MFSRSFLVSCVLALLIGACTHIIPAPVYTEPVKVEPTTPKGPKHEKEFKNLLLVLGEGPRIVWKSLTSFKELRNELKQQATMVLFIDRSEGHLDGVRVLDWWKEELNPATEAKYLWIRGIHLHDIKDPHEKACWNELIAGLDDVKPYVYDDPTPIVLVFFKKDGNDTVRVFVREKTKDSLRDFLKSLHK